MGKKVLRCLIWWSLERRVWKYSETFYLVEELQPSPPMFNIQNQKPHNQPSLLPSFPHFPQSQIPPNSAGASERNVPRRTSPHAIWTLFIQNSSPTSIFPIFPGQAGRILIARVQQIETPSFLSKPVIVLRCWVWNAGSGGIFNMNYLESQKRDAVLQIGSVHCALW